MGTESCLTDQVILAKINQLRELNVGSIIPLPQLVAVGHQPSGKSSITCLYKSQKSVSVSIISRPDADKALKSRLLKFQRRLMEIDNDELAKIFDEAHRVMEIRMSTDSSDTGVGAFSQDILKIEISGPEVSFYSLYH
ncbi:uncharacterized protein BDW70DRAFT_157665 [Aspergillus foveolatus]|uniref:uncharacterized protein n=1 Tax=Aspergillus foveolatus TaxID=210207 RepID=UPI003CCCE89B